MECPFCSPERELFIENDHALAVYDGFPVSVGHTLIIPKKHVKDLASCTDLALVSDLMSIPSLLSELCGQDSFKLLTNNGYAAGQRVFHLHFHFMAGKTFSE